jgi:hypothetical protein
MIDDGPAPSLPSLLFLYCCHLHWLFALEILTRGLKEIKYLFQELFMLKIRRRL